MIITHRVSRKCHKAYSVRVCVSLYMQHRLSQDTAWNMKDLLDSNSMQDNKLWRKLKFELVWHFSIKPFPSQHFPIKARSFCRINLLLNKIDSNAYWGPQVKVYLTCLFQCSVRALTAMLVCTYLGWATLKAFGLWFRFLKNGDELKSTNALWGCKTQKWSMFLKWQRQGKKKKIITTQSTLNYQRFQLFTVWSTQEKKLQSFRDIGKFSKM